MKWYRPFKNSCQSKYAGTVETISDITGQVILRGAPHPVQVQGFLPGKVIEVLENQGVVIEKEVSFIQGIFGIGGETFGELKTVCDSHDQLLTNDLVTEDFKAKIIVGSD